MQGFALRGEFLSGCPERNQRGTRARLRMSASRSYSPPLDPILRGPPMREAGNHRKGAGGHWIGFRSITAAAERPVTFGWCFSWLEARLLGWWGSSSAQGTCTLGSLLVPVGAAHWAAPTVDNAQHPRAHPHPPPSGAPSPLKGEGLMGKAPSSVWPSASHLPPRGRFGVKQDSRRERWWGNPGAEIEPHQR